MTSVRINRRSEKVQDTPYSLLFTKTLLDFVADGTLKVHARNFVSIFHASIFITSLFSLSFPLVSLRLLYKLITMCNKLYILHFVNNATSLILTLRDPFLYPPFSHVRLFDLGIYDRSRSRGRAYGTSTG